MVFAIGVPVQLFWEGFFIGVAGLYAAACPVGENFELTDDDREWVNCALVAGREVTAGL